MFEVGKKYKWRDGSPSPTHFECIAITPTCDVVFKNMSTDRLCIAAEKTLDRFVEVKEPRTVTGWVNVWEASSGELEFGKTHPTEGAAKACAYGLKSVDTMKITYTEKNT